MPTRQCPCRKISCKRHGDCDACRAHHRNSKYPPYCESRRALQKSRGGKKDETGENTVGT